VAELFALRDALNRTFDLVFVVAFMFCLSLSLQRATWRRIRLHVDWLRLNGF